MADFNEVQSNQSMMGSPTDYSDHEEASVGLQVQDDRYSLNKPGNSMLRDRALGPANVKVNKKNGY